MTLLLLIAALAAPAAPAARPAAPPEERLSPAEKQERADKALEKMRGQVAEVQKIVAQARNEKDIVKLNCATERLAQVQGLVKVSEQSGLDLREASQRKDDDAADRAFTRLSIAGRKVGQLSKDAQQCIGQLAFYTDEKTILDVDVPQGLLPDPTADAGDATVFFRPPPASGF